MEYPFHQLEAVFHHLTDTDIQNMKQFITSHRRIFVYGAGRTGLMMKAFAMRLAQTDRTVYVAGETITPAISKDDILILASASGKTASILRFAETAKSVGAQLFALTASADSPLAQYADSFVHLPAPTKDTAPHSSIMGTVFEQALLLLCDLVIQELGEDVTQMRLRHANLE